MGNRAVIAFRNDPNAVGIYLHWNGGRDSVQAFLDYAKEVGVRKGDESYAIARLCQIAGNALGGTLSLGLGILSELDCANGDNGVYIVDPDTLDIKERLFFSGPEQVEEWGLVQLEWVRERNNSAFSGEQGSQG